MSANREDGPEPNRRAVMTGIAWSVPVIAMAAAVPQAAASEIPGLRIVAVSPGLIEYQYATEVTVLLSGGVNLVGATDVRVRFTPTDGGTPTVIYAKPMLNLIRLPVLISTRLLPIGQYVMTIIAVLNGRELFSPPSTALLTVALDP